MDDKKEQNIDGQYNNQNGQPAEPRKEMPGETPVDHSVQELNDPRANDPNQTPTSKEDQAAYPAEHEERLAQELGAHGEATKSSLEAEHARKFQQEQAEIEERTHGTVATPATQPGQQPATTGTLAQPVPAQTQSHASPVPNTSAGTQNDSPTPVTETHR